MQAAVSRQAAARRFAMPALLLLLTAGFYWKLTFTNQFAWSEAPEQAQHTLPWLDYQAREVHAGRLPLWDAYDGEGYSLLGRAHPGTANPLNWILFLFPLRDGHIRPAVRNWYWVLLHWLAALAMYGLCREAGARPAASLLGAGGFGMSGFVGASLEPRWVSGALWIPWVLLFSLRALRGVRPVANAAVAGASLGLAALSGEFQVPFSAGVVILGIWAFAAVRQRSARAWLPAAVFILVAGCVSALQVLPAAAAPAQAGDSPASYSSHDAASAPARAVLGMIVPGWSERPNSFLGVVVVSFAVLGLAATWDSRATKILGTFVAAGFVLAIGNDSVFQGMLYALLPLWGKLGSPGAAVAVSQVGVCALAALGLNAWPRFPHRMALRNALLSFGGAIFALYTVLALARIDPADQRPMMTALAALLLVPVLYGWERGQIGPGPATACILALALLEAGAVSSVGIPNSSDPGARTRRMREQADIAGYLRLQPGWFRVETDDREVPYGFGNWFGFDQVRPRSDEERRVLGVRFWIGSQPRHGALKAVFASRSGLKVFRDESISGALFTVHDRVKGSPSPLAACDGRDEVALESRTNSFVVVRAGMRCPGMLVAAVADAPGWRVWVDRKPGRIVPAYGHLQGVLLEGGEHRVEFRYDPAVVYWGAGLTFTGLLLAAVTLRIGDFVPFRGVDCQESTKPYRNVG